MLILDVWTYEMQSENLTRLSSNLKSHFVKVGTASFDGTTRHAEDGSLRSPCSSECVVFMRPPGTYKVVPGGRHVGSLEQNGTPNVEIIPMIRLSV